MSGVNVAGRSGKFPGTAVTGLGNDPVCGSKSLANCTEIVAEGTAGVTACGLYTDADTGCAILPEGGHVADMLIGEEHEREGDRLVEHLTDCHHVGTSLRGSDVSTNDCVNYLCSLIGITCHPLVASAESMYTKCHGHYTKVMPVDGLADERDTTILSPIAVNLWYTGGGTEALLHLRPLDGPSDPARTDYALNAWERVAVSVNVHNGKSSVLDAPGREWT